MADAMPEPDDAAAVSPGPIALPGQGPRSDGTATATEETDSGSGQADGASKATATLALVAVAGLLVSLTQSLLVPVLPQLALDLHASATSTEWLLTSTLLVGAVAVPVFGRLGDLYGKRLMLLVTLVTFVAGSLICAFTSDIGVMIAGRAVVGLSVAAIPVGISLVGTVLPPKRAGTGIAYAAMPSLILRSAPRGELAAANGLNSLARAVGSSLASAVGGTILTSQVIILGGLALPSLSAYRTLFAICAAAAIAGAVIALVIPASPAVSAAAAADTASAH